MSYKDPSTIKELLIDGDMIVYRSGFACKPGDPVEHALSNCNNTLNKILSKFPGCEYTVYLQGKGNFRDQVATIKPYKGNRDANFKPEHYGAIRTHLEEHWGAELVDGMEADDAMGMAQYAKPDASTCIVSIDKDMDMIPGWHYKHTKDELYYVGLRDANTFYYRQLLIGDAIDNIPGIRGIGKVKARRYIPSSFDDAEAQRVVEQLFGKAYGASAGYVLEEVKQLIWIKREPNDNPK